MSAETVPELLERLQVDDVDELALLVARGRGRDIRVELACGHHVTVLRDGVELWCGQCRRGQRAKPTSGRSSSTA